MARQNFTHKNKKEDNGPNVCSLKFAQWGSCCLITKIADAIFVCICNDSDDHKKVRLRLILNIASGGEGSWPDDDDGNDYH